MLMVTFTEDLVPSHKSLINNSIAEIRFPKICQVFLTLIFNVPWVFFLPSIRITVTTSDINIIHELFSSFIKVFYLNRSIAIFHFWHTPKYSSRYLKDFFKVILFCYLQLPSEVGLQSYCNRSFVRHFCVVTLIFGFFCVCRGFCHRTAESDLFLFLSEDLPYVTLTMNIRGS